MNNNKTNNIVSNKVNKINTLIDNFIKKILEIEKEKSTLEDKVSNIDNLLDNLIDYCIKKKIYYYIEKNIGYSDIINSFKLHLCIFLQKLIDPSNNIINKYIENLEKNENFDNYSDINSLLFRKFKSGSTKSTNSVIKNDTKTSGKNVSFREDISLIAYDDSDGFAYNIKKSESSESSESSVSNENSNELDPDRLALYIKILLSQNKNIIEFIEKISSMCKIISDPEINYNKKNPFG